MGPVALLSLAERIRAAREELTNARNGVALSNTALAEQSDIITALGDQIDALEERIETLTDLQASQTLKDECMDMASLNTDLQKALRAPLLACAILEGIKAALQREVVSERFGKSELQDQFNAENHKLDEMKHEHRSVEREESSRYASLMRLLRDAEQHSSGGGHPALPEAPAEAQPHARAV